MAFDENSLVRMQSRPFFVVFSKLNFSSSIIIFNNS